MYLYICVIDCCLEAQRLVISPRGTQIKTAHTGAMFTCSVADYELPPDWTSGPSIRWLGPGLSPITATRGRSVLFAAFFVLHLYGSTYYYGAFFLRIFKEFHNLLHRKKANFIGRL